MSDSQTNPPREPNPFAPPAENPAPPVTPAAPASAPAAPPMPSAPPAPQPAPPAPPAVQPAPPAPPAVQPAPAAPPAVQPAPAAPLTVPAVLDEGTYTGIRTPRSPAALALDGTWHQISPRYVVSQFVQYAIVIVLVAIAAVVAATMFEQNWVWIPAGAFIAINLITLAILPRQAKALGYMLRADDVVFRRGILWQRMVAVPYGRMQLVDITQGPLDRIFGLAQLKMVTAAAATGVQIPGLTQGAAEALRDTLIEVAETRRTGL